MKQIWMILIVLLILNACDNQISNKIITPEEYNFQQSEFYKIASDFSVKNNVTIEYRNIDMPYCASFNARKNTIIIINMNICLNGSYPVNYVLEHELKHIRCFDKYGTESGHPEKCGF